MGNIVFRRKKVVTEELEEIQRNAESLQKEIVKIVSSKQSTQWLCSLTLFAMTGISTATLLFYETDKKRRTLYAILSAFAGFLLIYVSTLLSNIYYGWSIGRRRKAHEQIMKRKLAILEKVKETETFKVAKEILDKYEDLSEPPPEPKPTSGSPRSRRLTLTPSMKFRDPSNAKERASVTENGHVMMVGSEKGEEQSGEEETLPNASSTQSLTGAQSGNVRPAQHLQRGPPRPFISQERSVTERIVDILLGDGPNQRYALVCGRCYAHNGMAREDEFDYFSYQCWVCGAFNPSRKQRVRPRSYGQPGELKFRSESANMLANTSEERCRKRLRSLSVERPPDSASSDSEVTACASNSQEAEASSLNKP